MSTLLIAIATAASIALTWFFCLRPMLLRTGSDTGKCCPPTVQTTDERIRAAREELSQLQNARPGTGPNLTSSPRRDA